MVQAYDWLARKPPARGRKWGWSRAGVGAGVGAGAAVGAGVGAGAWGRAPVTDVAAASSRGGGLAFSPNTAPRTDSPTIEPMITVVILGFDEWLL